MQSFSRGTQGLPIAGCVRINTLQLQIVANCTLLVRSGGRRDWHCLCVKPDFQEYPDNGHFPEIAHPGRFMPGLVPGVHRNAGANTAAEKGQGDHSGTRPVVAFGAKLEIEYVALVGT
ncbi:MAG: hypothetical protein V4505_17140 [Pseudomonadota bacterium]